MACAVSLRTIQRVKKKVLLQKKTTMRLCAVFEVAKVSVSNLTIRRQCSQLILIKHKGYLDSGLQLAN